MSGRGSFGIDPRSPKDVQKLMRDLRKIDPELVKETRKRFKSAAGPALADVRRRQPSRSGRLRRQTKIRVTRGRAEIRSSAPHARISEFGGRHPLWGRDQWVNQPPSPAVFPGTAAHRADFVRQAEAALVVAATKAGFR